MYQSMKHNVVSNEDDYVSLMDISQFIKERNNENDLLYEGHQKVNVIYDSGIIIP